MKAVYAGSFDPFTCGHLEIIREASNFFDELIVVISVNSKKNRWFNRFAMRDAMVECLRDEGIKNALVLCSDKLTVDVCAELGAEYLVRGLRNVNDFLYEEEIAKFNQRLDPFIKTVYFRAKDETLSSTCVRELFFRAKDVSSMVPLSVYNMMEKLNNEQIEGPA